MSFAVVSIWEPQWLQNISAEGKRSEAKTYKSYADAMVKQKQLAQAITNYRQAIKVDPDYVDARVNLGVALGRYGYPDEAIRVLREGLTMSPPLESVIYYNIAWIMAEQGDTSGAIENYQQALADDPDLHFTLNRLGMLYEGRGDWLNAYNCYSQALEHQLDIRTSYYSMLRRSLPHYLRPKDSLSRRNLEAQISEGVAREMLSMFDTTLIKQLIDRPTISRTFDRLGIASLALGYRDAGAHYLDQAVKVWPDNREAAAHLRQLRESGN